jgi:hypothetical protein
MVSFNIITLGTSNNKPPIKVYIKRRTDTIFHQFFFIKKLMREFEGTKIRGKAVGKKELVFP